MTIAPNPVVLEKCLNPNSNGLPNKKMAKLCARRTKNLFLKKFDRPYTDIIPKTVLPIRSELCV